MRIFHRQFWHLLSVLIVLWTVSWYIQYDGNVLQGQLMGISTEVWLAMAVAIPPIHQFYVLICWRLELSKKALSKRLGSRAFMPYKIGFAILFGLRPVSLILVGISNYHSLAIGSAWQYGLAILLFIPSVYLFYSVRKYFGINRAFGIDHFEPEKFKNTVMVKKGIFRFSPNAMYVFGFMLLWALAFLLASKAALLVAFVNHVLIWAHYYFTERPDMKAIYGK